QNDDLNSEYITGDLFSCPRDESLAHCISEDCRMGAGIAVMFKKKFGRVSELKEQKKLPGQCAVLAHDQRFIYYLNWLWPGPAAVVKGVKDPGTSL
uniref:Macro domain-containing protein n=1 Tax=Poecilia mexicana TaxID=48701 RepID=A0A3B3Z374_9TELE